MFFKEKKNNLVVCFFMFERFMIFRAYILEKIHFVVGQNCYVFFNEP